MGQNTKIAWAHHTFNPWYGCTKVSEGCRNCYAKTLMHDRYHKVTWGPGQARKRTAAANWREPKKWDRIAGEKDIRERVFCASLADVFDAEVDPSWRDDLFKLIAECKNLDWLVLTKRPREMVAYFNSFDFDEWEFGGCLENVWPGVSVENQEAADTRIQYLNMIPSRYRFLSCEPLIGPVDLKLNRLDPIGFPIDWVIAGGESGPGARQCEVRWIHDLKVQCIANDVSFFMKQLGSKPTHGGIQWKVKHSKGEDPYEWPPELRVQEVPGIPSKVVL